jgi:hypothetical protein
LFAICHLIGLLCLAIKVFLLSLQSALPSEVPEPESSSMDCQIGSEEATSACGIGYDDETTIPVDVDVLLGSAGQDRSNGTVRFHDFVDKFFAVYDACRGRRRSSLAGEVLEKWRSSLEHPGRFLARSNKGWVVVMQDQRIVSTIWGRWIAYPGYLLAHFGESQTAMPEDKFIRKMISERLRLSTKRETERVRAEAYALLWARQENRVKNRASISPSKRTSNGNGTFSVSASIMTRFGVIREADERDAREQGFYEAARAAGLSCCDPTELDVNERLGLFHLGRQHGFELSDQESKVLDRLAD